MWRNVAITAMILVVILSLFGVYSFSIGDSASRVDADVEVVAGDCNTAPTLTVTAVDAESRGTILTTGVTYLVNGLNYGQTAPSFAQGDKVELLLNGSGLIDTIVEEFTIACGANKVSVPVKDYTAPTLQIYEDNAILTDSATGGAENGSAVGLGGSETFEVRLTGTDKDTSGDLIYVVELATNTNVSDVTMYDSLGSNLVEADVPDFYVNSLSSPFVKAFEIPEVIGAKEIKYFATVTAKSGKGISGAVYTSAYVKEGLTLDDGSFSVDVEDENGNADYEATFDYDFYME